jgi:hypothetical protein
MNVSCSELKRFNPISDITQTNILAMPRSWYDAVAADIDHSKFG